MSAGDVGGRPPAAGGDPQSGRAQKNSGSGGTHPDDLLSSYLLGLLDGQERDAVEAHVQECATCAAELRSLQAALDVLPLAAPPLAPPARVRQALMARVAAAVHGNAASDEASLPAAAIASSEPVPMPAYTPPASHAWERFAGWAAALASTVVALVAGWQLIVARQELATVRRAQAMTEAALRQQQDVLAQIDPQTTRVVSLRGSAQAATISGRLLYEVNGTNGLAVLEHLPPLPAGTVYQLWLLQASTPVSAGTFRPDESGTGTLVVHAPSAISGYTGLGLTAEREPGVPFPSGAILATGAL